MIASTGDVMRFKGTVFVSIVLAVALVTGFLLAKVITA